MPEGRWDFYIQIAEACDTMRRHQRDFAAEHMQESVQSTAMLSYHLRQCENLARTLAGPTNTGSPSPSGQGIETTG